MKPAPLVIAMALAACGTPPPSWAPDAGPCVAYVSPPGTDLTTPVVSFHTDVMPVLTANCASASCHGVRDGAQGGLFLGAQLMKGADAAAVFESLVGGMSGQLTSMPYVTAGDPSASYLMHKLDNDQCVFDATCANHDCARAMPFDRPLPPETRDIVRRWIAQGAQAN